MGQKDLKRGDLERVLNMAFAFFCLFAFFFLFIYFFSFSVQNGISQILNGNCQIARLNVHLLHQNLQSLCPTSQRPTWRVEAANEKRQQQNRSAAHHHLTERQKGKRSRCQSVIQVKYLIFHDRMNVTR